MVIQEITAYKTNLPDAKRNILQMLPEKMRQLMPGAKLRSQDRNNNARKVVSNPTIGYGSTTIGYPDGTTREFYRFGWSANTIDISMSWDRVYVMGWDDKEYRSRIPGRNLAKRVSSSRVQIQITAGYQSKCIGRIHSTNDRIACTV